MSTNVDAMVRAGVDAYRAGNKVEARALLEKAIEIDGYNETAWLWLSAVVETKEEQQTCLENVLVINPENSRAVQGLKSLGVDPQAVIDAANAQDDYVEEPVAQAGVDDVFGDVDFSNDADGGDVFGDIDFTDDVGGDDLFGDVDFADDGGGFEIDDSIFEEETYDDQTYAEDDAGVFEDDYGYQDDGVFDEFDDGDDMFADIGTLENYTDAVGDDIDYDDSQFASDPFAPPPPAPEEKPRREELTPDQLFAKIPKDIVTTRSPGIVEPVPQIHYIILGVLAVINVIALAFVGFQFVS